MTPKASLAGVSGLDALVGGNYIGMMPGSGKEQTHFTALDTQPKYRLNTGELMIHLHADDLGSLNSGSLVYYRKIPVGKVYDYTISEGNKGVTIDVLIDRRFAHLVKNNSRFWNVSGFKGDFSLSGATVQMESGGAGQRRHRLRFSGRWPAGQGRPELCPVSRSGPQPARRQYPAGSAERQQPE